MTKSFGLRSCLTAVALTFGIGASASESEPRFPTCEDEILSLPAARYAAHIYPSFNDFESVRERIALVREYAQPYLSEREVRRLQSAMDDIERGSEHGYVRRGVVSVLLNAAELNLVREFASHVDQVESDLSRRAKILFDRGDFAYHRWLTELLTRVDHYRRGISIEYGAWYWQHARYEAAQSDDAESKPDPELPAWVTARRPGIALATPRSTHGLFSFIKDLTVLPSAFGRYQLRRALYRAFKPPNPSSNAPVAPESTYQMARVSDLNLALTFFVDTPRINAIQSRHTLEGSTLLKGVVTPISVVFDAQWRYFTVRTLSADRSMANYFQLILDSDGHLQLVDAAPVPADVAHRRLDLTHFAY